MKIFVLSRQHQNLVSVDFGTMFHRAIRVKPVSKRELEQVFDESNKDALIACTSMEDAEKVLHCLKIDPQKWPQYNPNDAGADVILYASPVIFTLEVSDDIANMPEETLTGADLTNYSINLHTTPMYPPYIPNPELVEKQMNAVIASYPQTIKIRKVPNLQGNFPESAHYCKVDGKTLAAFNLNAPDPASQFSCNLL